MMMLVHRASDIECDDGQLAQPDDETDASQKKMMMMLANHLSDTEYDDNVSADKVMMLVHHLFDTEYDDGAGTSLV